jgi:pyridinium-3,5-biscarboxylic acid mononucleotide sulfurtransferase
MTVSSSTPPEDHQQATALAEELAIALLVIDHDELAIPQYAANPVNRCYFCKDSLYDICRREAARLSLRTIADGVNLDDLHDYRPGIQAAKEYQIVHPLVEAEFTKVDIRQASRLLGLPTWKNQRPPASPLVYLMELTSQQGCWRKLLKQRVLFGHLDFLNCAFVITKPMLVLN